MQPYPDTELAQRFAQRQHPGLEWLAVPEVDAVFDVDPIGAGVL